MIRDKGLKSRLLEIEESLSTGCPHLAAWSADEDSYRELRIQLRDDGTMLVIAKGFGPDGGHVVCFGVGYGLSGGLLAIDRTIQGGNWKFDKPWSPNGEGKENNG
jgi:hypothetical protein